MLHHWTTRDDRELHAVEQGPGPQQARATVVLVHGYVLSSGIWGQVARELAAGGLRVIRPDLAGHGWSRAGEHDLDLGVLADDLAAQMEALTLPPGHPVVMVGHSMGGMVMMQMLERHPRLAGRVDGLVWLATSPGGMTASPFGLPLRASALVSPVVSRVAPAVMARAAGRTTDRRPRPRAGAREVELAHLARSNFAGRPPRAVVHQVAAMHHRVPYRVLSHLLSSILVHDGRDALRALDCPGLVLIGDDDRMTPHSHSAEIAELHQGADLQVVPSAGHLVMVERPHEVATAIAGLVDRAAGEARQSGGAGEAGGASGAQGRGEGA